MTRTEWKQIERRLLYGNDVSLRDGGEIVAYRFGYGWEYSLRCSDGNVVICTWDIRRIAELVID